jgi:hypothetical protein
MPVYPLKGSKAARNDIKALDGRLVPACAAS